MNIYTNVNKVTNNARVREGCYKIAGYLPSLSLQIVIANTLQRINLCKSRFFGGHVAPLLDNWLLDLSRVSFGSCTDFFGDINTLLLGLQLRHQLCHVLAGPLGLE